MTVLIVTNSNDPTVDLVVGKLRERGTRHFRLNTDLVLTDMSHSFLLGMKENEDLQAIRTGLHTLEMSEITSVWYRRPVDPQLSPLLQSEKAREFALAETSYYLRCLWKVLEHRNWVSHPAAINWANTKLHQLMLAREVGFQIPRSLATNDPSAAARFLDACQGKVVVKPFRVNSLQYSPEDMAGIFTSRVTHSDMADINSVAYAMTFFQEEAVKQEDVRVTVFGSEVFAAAVESQLDPNLMTDWRRTTSSPPRWQPFDLLPAVTEKCRRLVKLLGLQFGAIDLAHTPTGELVFFEINPNGQWAWLEIEAGLPMSDCLLRLLS